MQKNSYWNVNLPTFYEKCFKNNDFINGPSLAFFSVIFVVSNKHYNSYNKYMWKCIDHPVYGAGIRTHDLCNNSLLP